MAEWQNPQTIAIWIGIALFVVVTLIASIILFSRIYFKRILEEQNKLALAEVEHQKKLLNDSVLVQERERSRIAADLHDDLISKLNILKLSHHANKPPEQIEEMLDNSIHVARRISHDLSPPLIEEVSLEELIHEFENSLQNTVDVTFIKQNLSNRAIASDTKLQLLRIVQEVINNILKHARAKHIFVNLRISKNRIALLIKDDGIGFDTGKKVKGLGMKNIELRSQLLKAEYRFKSNIKKGTTFVLYINESGM